MSPSTLAERRDLKTAGGVVGVDKLESELLAKDIAYKGGMSGYNMGLLAGARAKIGRSTDDAAFRRSMVINNRVLQDRDASSPGIDRM